MGPQEYLLLTEHAVRHFYAGLHSCWAHYEQALTHWNVSRVGQTLTDEEKERLNKYLHLAGKYFSLKFSEGTFAGAIVQVAATGIRLFSTNKTVPDDCIDIVPTEAKGAIPFCIGKRMYGLPIGLIIYAARNQYAHWEKDPYQVTNNVFHRLTMAFYDNTFYDLAFDLGNPSINIYANEILLGGLHWDTYEKYLSEMRSLLDVDDKLSSKE